MKKVFLSLTLVVALCIAYAQPRIEFDNKTHDFGTIREEGGKVTARFVFKNTGDSALVLTKVKPGCGCMVPDYTKDPILPGQKGKITLKFDSTNFDGLVNKQAEVYANVEKAPIVLTFSADIQPN